MTKSKAMKRLEAENRTLRQRLRRKEQLYTNDIKSRQTLGTRVPNQYAEYIKQLARISGRCTNEFIVAAIKQHANATHEAYCKRCQWYEGCSPAWMPCRDGAALQVAPAPRP